MTDTPSSPPPSSPDRRPSDPTPPSEPTEPLESQEPLEPVESTEEPLEPEAPLGSTEPLGADEPLEPDEPLELLESDEPLEPLGLDGLPEPPPDSEPPTELETEQTGLKWWWLIALIVVALVVVVAALLGGDDEDAPAVDDTEASEPAEDDGDGEVAEGTDPGDDADGTQEPGSEPGTDPEDGDPDPDADPDDGAGDDPVSELPIPPGGFGDGTYTVGEDIDPGIYRSTAQDPFCYWARLSGLGGEIDDIIANGSNAPEIVLIGSDDVAFETQGCGPWVDVEETFPDEPATSFEDGTYVVGEHIEPGSYQAEDDDDGDFCYWARLSDFEHGVDGIPEHGTEAATIEIQSDDVGFTTFGCGTWTQS